MGRGRVPEDAFRLYASMGAGRSYQALAERLKVSKRAIVKHAAREGWQTRLTTVQLQARVSSDAKAAESLSQMNDRHLRIVQTIQAKALEVMRNGSLSMDAVRALDIAMKHERIIKEDADPRGVVTVEHMLKEQYARWMNDHAAGDGVNAEIPDEHDGDGGVLAVS